MFVNNNGAIKFILWIFIQIKHQETPTVEKGRVHDTATKGKSQSQLSNSLKHFSHGSNLLTTTKNVIWLTQVVQITITYKIQNL